MEPKVLEFLTKERVCALSVLLPDNSLYAAAMHFSFSENTLEFYFSTSRESHKFTAFQNNSQVASSMVIGLSEEEWKTMQISGKLEVVANQEEIQKIKAVHYQRHPKSKDFESDPNTVFLKLTPTFHKFTDFKEKK